MAVTITQNEIAPDQFPEIAPYPHRHVDDLLPEEAALSHMVIWQRIEQYIAYRFVPRTVVWHVEGEGHWTPPLAPATITAALVWENGGWSETTLPAGPYGYCLPGDGPYKITATVGEEGATVPEDVHEAYRRLHEYFRGVAEQFKADAALRSFDGDDIAPNWTARALQLSGAADLLRPYRRV
ncbi:hypothetical protein [Qingshengfaniella alkalisoli]|uniref:PhiE125 gp8 family phage protein n=1 Tax=Qingshengfaniella alkalisoli TaxID=2599296 RepID=A0A5B8J644_9RHOB|nr:hypothetical protein [Qingshengfaniella alkalisoli]QDY69810.1 hypothetical protein FPZ52_09375 [Qingshengfaniella alkalisoli]